MSNAECLDATQLASEMRDALDATGTLGKTRVLEILADRDLVRITMEIDQWTVSLVRRIGVPIPLFALRSEVRDSARHHLVTLSRTERLRSVQLRRHRVAMAHGLSLTGEPELDALSVQVDRTTALLLWSAGTDLPGLVLLHRRTAQDNGDEDETGCGAPSPLRQDVYSSTRLRETDTTPILIYEQPIRGAKLKSELRHDVFAVEASLPDTILAAAPGRRLGEMVATSIPTLDRRRIVQAQQSDGSISFTLEPDLITIGYAMKLFASN